MYDAKVQAAKLCSEADGALNPPADATRTSTEASAK